jgi:hypothetical protein
MLPDSAELIALFPDFGAVLTIEAKLVGGPEYDANCYNKWKASLHCLGLARNSDRADWVAAPYQAAGKTGRKAVKGGTNRILRMGVVPSSQALRGKADRSAQGVDVAIAATVRRIECQKT